MGNGRGIAEDGEQTARAKARAVAPLFALYAGLAGCPNMAPECVLHAELLNMHNSVSTLSHTGLVFLPARQDSLRAAAPKSVNCDALNACDLKPWCILESVTRVTMDEIEARLVRSRIGQESMRRVRRVWCQDAVPRHSRFLTASMHLLQAMAAQQGAHGQRPEFDELFTDNAPTVSGIRPGQRDVLDEQAFLQGPGARS